MTGQHRLTWTSFAALAAGLADPAGLAVLKAGQYGRHLLMLRALVDEARACGAGARVEPALELLTEAQRRSPAAAELLSYPYVGAWLASCLRRPARTGREIGHAAAVAASAAVTAGLEFRIDVPSTGGGVVLPALGRADAGGTVEVVGRAGQVVVGRTVVVPDDPARDGPGWQGLRRLTAPDWPAGPALRLDDLDPFRAPPGFTVTGRLDDRAAWRWQHLFGEAFGVLWRWSPERAGHIAGVVRALTPLAELGRWHGLSATSRHAFGAAALTDPGSATRLAATLCHEVQHAKLYALLDIVPLVEEDDGSRYYAPWRTDPRPLSALLNGTYAFLGVADFWHGQTLAGGRRRAPYEFARVSHQVRAALEALSRADGLTAYGRRFVAGMADTAGGWELGQVAQRPRALARIAADHHHIRWRLRNVIPEPAAVRALADAWRANRSASTVDVASRVISAPEAFGGDARADLLAMLGEGRPADGLRGRGPGLLDGDLLLADGRYEQAVASFRGTLSRDAGHPAGWTGLALARQYTAGAPEAAVWRTGPELVRAVYLELVGQGGQTPAPEDLAGWLGAVVEP